ncbi:MAG: YtxH protein [Paenibacillaceae bacterium]|jgi:gas vesicle protein|nr:YtxH protein [Paenibacillaceae bacterium]
MSDNQGNSGKSFLAGAVVGGVLGALTALLLAPKSGQELRKDLGDQYKEVSHKTQDLAKGIADTTSEWTSIAKETVGNVAEEVKSWRNGRKEVAASVEETAQDAEEENTEKVTN